MTEAVKFAEESPQPEASELYTDVYVDDPAGWGGR
jgi:TPP-dependent pyruvate/acetoin dehydrogenase alpha subunit